MYTTELNTSIVNTIVLARNIILQAIFGVLLVVFSVSVTASETIKIIVPAPPGGPLDVGARLLQNTLTQQIDPKIASFVVENRPGAGTVLGTQLVAKNKKNETVLLLQSQAVVISYLLNPKSFDLYNDLIPIANIGNFDTILVSSKKSKLTTFNELIANKNRLMFYSSGGQGTGSHISAEILQKQLHQTTGTMVHYKGQAPALFAVASGDVDLTFVGVKTAIAQRDKVNLLAVTSNTRLPSLPSLPTFLEYNGFNLPPNYLMLFSNTTANPELVKLIKKSLIIAATDPVEVSKYADGGLEFNFANLSKNSNFIRQDASMLAKIIKKSSIGKE